MAAVADGLVSTSEYQPLREDTETQKDSEITNFLNTLSGDGPGALSYDKIESICLCCRFALEITPQQIESLLETSFSYLFEKGIRVSKVVTRDDTAEDGTPNRIDPEDLLYFMLKRLGYSMPDGLPRSTSPHDNNVYKQIDIILTLATTVLSMRENDYDKFKRFHTEQKGGVLRQCNIKDRCDLVRRLLDKKSLHEEENIGIVFDWLQVSGCSAYEKELRKCCDRHKVAAPLKTRCRLVSVTVSVILLLFSITSISLAIFLVTSPIDVTVRDPQNMTYPIGPSTTVKLDCFDTSITDTITATAIILDKSISTTIYTIPEGKVSTCSQVLPNINLSNCICGFIICNSSIHNLPIPVSYNTCYEPIYTANGGGTLNYSIDLVNSNPDRVFCAMRLFGFSFHSDYISYYNAARDPQNVPFDSVYSSACVGSNGTHSFSITLPRHSLLYFVLAVVNHTTVNVNVSGNISAYSNAARYRGDECNLTRSDRSCSIVINPKKTRHNGDVCLFVNSTYAHQGKVNLFTTFITRRVYFQKYWIPLIPLGLFTLIFFLILFFVIPPYYLCESYKRRKRIADAARTLAVDSETSPD